MKEGMLISPERRQALLQEQGRINDELRRCKKDLGLVCASGRKGRYLPPLEFFQLKLRIDGLKRRSQELQAEIGLAKKAMKGPGPEPKAKPGPQPKSSTSDAAFEAARRRMEELRARQAPPAVESNQKGSHLS